MRSLVSHSDYSWVKPDWPTHLYLGYLGRHSERIQRPGAVVEAVMYKSTKNSHKMGSHSSQSNKKNRGSGGKRKRRMRGRNEISVQSSAVCRWAEQLQNYKGCCWFLALSKSLPFFSAVQLFVWWGCLLTSLCILTENHIIIFKNATQGRSRCLIASYASFDNTDVSVWGDLSLWSHFLHPSDVKEWKESFIGCDDSIKLCL